MNVYNFIKFGALTFVAVGGAFVIIYAIIVLRNEILYEYDSFSEFFSEIFSEFFSEAKKSIFGLFKKKKMKVKIRDLIELLDKGDFNIISETITGVAYISQNVSEKRLELSGETKVKINIPNHSVYVFCGDYDSKLSDVGMPESVWITEQQYSEYLDLVKGCNSVSTTSYFLKIKLQNPDVISLIRKWNNLSEYDVFTEYRFERYNVLNLVTNMQPFSEEEIDSIIDKIKDRMIARLHL